MNAPMNRTRLIVTSGVVFVPNFESTSMQEVNGDV